ncbi:hypothetical protein AGMMS49936_06650 [Endomicrobiia bacterium]|nr:hypothetical protein AGMMS49936_06650 [Endomicrobiia bacterium]
MINRAYDSDGAPYYIVEAIHKIEHMNSSNYSTAENIDEFINILYYDQEDAKRQPVSVVGGVHRTLKLCNEFNNCKNDTARYNFIQHYKNEVSGGIVRLV